MTDNLTERVTRTFAELLARQPAVIVRAPGRVNLIGEHTDYNGGFVLPCAISLETQVAAAARPDNTVQIIAADYQNRLDQFDLGEAVRHSNASWANYIRGVFKVLQDRGHVLGGTDLVIAGNIPQGAGLSSSASLSVAVAMALAELWQLAGLDSTEIARIAQISESEFVGCQCGIMDQLVSTSGADGHAVLIDCDTLTTQAIPMPADLAVMIVHSGISRGLVDGEYNDRRAQCEQAAAQLGVRQLRDADMSQLEQMREHLDGTVFRRARHVISENTRTLAAAECLARQDLAGLRLLMAASHDSMKNDFEITVPGVDELVDILHSAIGAEGADGGARMTGGGFGGAVVALMPADRVARVTDVVRASYRTPHGQPAEVMIETAVAGASQVPRG